jgi:ribosomal protein S18 acetylase RimI-like enzyme
VIYNGESLKEGYVQAFGVDPQLRRRGIGTALQQHAAQQIAAGYVLHPSHENDSYYFLLRL